MKQTLMPHWHHGAVTTNLPKSMCSLFIQLSVPVSGDPWLVGSEVFKDLGSRLRFGLFLCESTHTFFF